MSWFQLSIKGGRRHSTAVGYLHPVMGRANLYVATEAHATRILFEGRKAVGVEYVQKGARRTAKCRREVILAAGAVASPQLLEVSGIGRGDVLLMRPLLAHCSNRSYAGTLRHRRILHLEFAGSADLPDGYTWHTFLRRVCSEAARGVPPPSAGE